LPSARWKIGVLFLVHADALSGLPPEVSHDSAGWEFQVVAAHRSDSAGRPYVS
jgi:hypothetical protein